MTGNRCSQSVCGLEIQCCCLEKHRENRGLSPSAVQMAPRAGPRAAKSRRRGPMSGPRVAKRAPGGAQELPQDVSRAAQQLPGGLQERPQSRPRGLQERSWPAVASHEGLGRLEGSLWGGFFKDLRLLWGGFGTSRKMRKEETREDEQR